MNHVEFTQQPSRSELLRLPDGKVMVCLRENIVSEQRDGEDGTYTIWTADEYSMVKSPRVGLAQDVETRFNVYLLAAKAQEDAKAAADVVKQRKQDINNNIDSVIDDIDNALIEIADLLVGGD